jgi:hypothetical protein
MVNVVDRNKEGSIIIGWLVLKVNHDERYIFGGRESKRGGFQF